MSNFLSLFHEISDVIKVCIDDINILQKRSFRLTKFNSNNRSILQALPSDKVSPKITEINLSVNDIAIELPLGILWNLGTDIFHINNKYTLISVLATKQGIISLISCF